MRLTALGVLCSVALSLTSHAAPAVTLRPVHPATPAAAFKRMEWIVDLDRTYDNPFNPDEIRIDATFTGPNQHTLTLPAFWHQDFQRKSQSQGREQLIAQGPGHWRLRFAAPLPGTWQLAVTAKDATGTATSPALSFEVKPSARRGFVRRAPGNPRYFQFDSGSPYFMVGLNVAWANRGGLGDYETWFSKLGAAEANFVRIWMTYPNRPIETKQAGLGRYDLATCYYYDKVFETADRHNLCFMLALGSGGDLYDGGHFNEGRWAQSPYNALNNGPATRPSDFIEKSEIQDLYKRRLRYLIGRYSAFTNLAFWEFWNEQDNAKGIIKPGWVKEMAAYLKTHDPYRHLITTSYTNRGEDAIWNLSDIDLTQRHIYGDEDSMFDAIPVLAAIAKSHDVFGKPHLIGEYGITWRGTDMRLDPDGLGTNLHNALWSSALSGSAGGACNWWWDNYIHPKNLYGRFTGLARFAASIDWPRRRFEPIKVLSPISTQKASGTLGDIVLPCANAWGRSSSTPITVEPDGSISSAVPGYLYGPAKADLRVKATLRVDLPQPSRMIIRVLKVSDHATLRVFIDDKPNVDFAFSALPGAADQESAGFHSEHKDLHQATFNKDRVVNIPAGRHTIALDNVGGDWVSIGRITFTNALASNYTGLRTLAMQDRSSGETILWLQDPASHCGSDRAGLQPRLFEGALLALPVVHTNTYKAHWWDTRTGQIIRTDTAAPQDGHLTLAIPTFRRDIALRVCAVPK